MEPVRLTLHVQPKARANEIAGFDDANRLKVRVTAAPADGAANKAVVRLLSETLRIPKRAVTIERGHAARTKIVRIEGIAAVEVHRILSDG